MTSRTTKNGSLRSAKPHFLLDRGLTPRLATALQRAGFSASHLNDINGQHPAEDMSDHEVFAYAQEHGHVLLTKDKKMARRPTEAADIMERGLQVFCLANQQYTKEEQAYALGRHILQILRRCRGSGPFFWRIYIDDKVLRDLPRI
ncbi:hypothetical protein CKW39_08745 [Kocuria sp. WRN011]|uniref:DUF5615 family PIN-like protein n=1 Tax=Kocuria sp. WRN011 TaxID=2029858 RepID=UPI000BAF941C|nr:DUF5615 family PIN-like protein [Kocuria sp. WRN011]PBB08440.1 hypothetical protein CKW39_08745 [Kocuria sp. WRN011]